jgi:hypothetical protein
VTQPLAIITNSMSTRNLQGDAWIDPLLANEKNVVQFKLNNVEEIPDALNRCAAMGAETIIVNGGDGTADLVFAGLLNHGAYNHPPALALLPAGKTNMTAAAWSLTGKLEDSLRALLETRRSHSLSDYATERPVLGVHRGESRPPLYGAFFGAAEVVNGILFCRRHIYPLNMPNALSHTAAASTLLWRSMAASRTGEHLEVSSDSGMREEGHFFAVAVTALDQLLLGIRPRPEASELARGPLTYLSFRAGIYSTLRTIGSLASRSVAPGPGRTVCSAGRLTMKFNGTYTLDGELYEATADETLILDGSKRLRFIQIPKAAQK